MPGEGAGMGHHRKLPLPQDPSASAGFRFPPEVIMLAVRSCLRYGRSYRDVEELLTERGIRSRSRHNPPTGPTLHSPTHRRRPALPTPRRWSLVR